MYCILYIYIYYIQLFGVMNEVVASRAGRTASNVWQDNFCPFIYFCMPTLIYIKIEPVKTTVFPCITLHM
jgi:hypothetical protein